MSSTVLPYTGPSPGAGAPPNSPEPDPALRQVFANRSDGPIYGTQARERWAAGESDRRPIADAIRAESLWRVSVIGDVDVFIRYGTSGGSELELAAPVQGAFAGFVGVEAQPRSDETETTAVVTIAPVLDAGLQSLRALSDATAGAVALHPAAKRFQALTASTLTIRGVAVVVPALSEVSLVSGSVHTGGVGVVEHAT